MSDRITSEMCAAVIAGLRSAGLREPAGWSGGDPDRVAAMWARVLSDITPDELRVAALAWSRMDTPWLPSAGQLRAIARPEATDADLGMAGRDAWQQVLRVRDRAREHVGQVVRAWRQGGEALARERLGPIAWSALESLGGFAALDRAACAEDGGEALDGLQARFVADFRAIAKRMQREPVAPQRTAIEGREVRAIGADLDVVPGLGERLAAREVVRG